MRREIDRGACSVAEIARCTGAGTRCGSCRTTVAAMIDSSEARDLRSAHAPDPQSSPFTLVPSLG